MISDLDRSIRLLLEAAAPEGSELGEATISFEVPDAEWRAGLQDLTLSCYLYRISENRALRRGATPAPIDCAYCITAWSLDAGAASSEEHRLLSQVLGAVLRHRTRPPEFLWDGLDRPPVPAPVVTLLSEEMATPVEYWGALDHAVKPSLNCVFTLAMSPLGQAPPEPAPPVDSISVDVTPVALRRAGSAPSR